MTALPTYGPAQAHGDGWYGDGVTQLFDYASERPAGFTYRDIRRDLKWDRSHFFRTARALRLTLGDADDISLVCDRQGARQPWRYRLVGEFSQASDWVRNRTDDAESRMLTIESVLASVLRNTDGRSRDGRRARIMYRAIQRAREDLADLEVQPVAEVMDSSAAS